MSHLGPKRMNRLIVRQFFCSVHSYSSHVGFLQTWEDQLPFVLAHSSVSYASSIFSWFIKALTQTSPAKWLLTPSPLLYHSILLPCSIFLHSTYSLNVSYPFIYILQYKLHKSGSFVSPVHYFPRQYLACRRHAMCKWWINALTDYSYIETSN